MKNFTDNLATELTRNLEAIKEDHMDTCLRANTALKLVMNALEQLKAFVKNQPFETRQEEIWFFKVVKPTFFSKLIYYNEIYRIEITKPLGSCKSTIKHYRAEQRKLEKFYVRNADFYHYYRTGSKHLDKLYFTRGKFNPKVLVECSFFQTDSDFSTTHDFLISNIIANEELHKYVKQQIQRVQKNNEKRGEVTLKGENQLNWTGSKVALVELMYALQASGVINNGNTSLTSLANAFETIFNLKIPQFNRVFLEIKNRKSIEQTSFLNQLKSNLIKRMEDSEK